MIKTAVHLMIVLPAVCFQLLPLASNQRPHQPLPTGQTRTIHSTLPPVLKEIADERAEFQINLGRAMDTLRKDYPDILTRTPDFSIFDNNISVIDPSGVQLNGLEKYKSSFSFLQTFHRFWFRSSEVQFRMVYDFCRSSIRISWHVVLNPKFVGPRLHIDGISYYQLDRDSGKIGEHRIETLTVNNTPVAPPYGIFSLMQEDALALKPQYINLEVLPSTLSNDDLFRSKLC